MTKCGVMVLLSNKCVWKTRNPHQSRLPDGSILPQTDSGHFAVATLGSYPATISCTTRVLRHVLANAFNDITSLINEEGAKHRLRGFMPRNMVAPYEERSDEVRGQHKQYHLMWCEAPVEGLFAPKYGSPVRDAKQRSAG